MTKNIIREFLNARNSVHAGEVLCTKYAYFSKLPMQRSQKAR